MAKLLLRISAITVTINTPHSAAPIEIRLFGNLFCTYTSHGTHTRKLTESNIMEALDKKFNSLRICPVCILDKRPIDEPMLPRL